MRSPVQPNIQSCAPTREASGSLFTSHSRLHTKQHHERSFHHTTVDVGYRIAARKVVTSRLEYPDMIRQCVSKKRGPMTTTLSGPHSFLGSTPTPHRR